MLRAAKIALLLIAIATVAQAQQIPALLQGKWIITRDLPTETISCWDENEARRLIGTEIEYTAHSFRWKNHVTEDPTVTVRELTAARFDEEYFGGPNDSRVDFRQLGIRATEVTQIQLGHPDADITGATVEIPGDGVLIKDKNTIIFSVCNVYFVARRLRDHKTSHP